MTTPAKYEDLASVVWPDQKCLLSIIAGACGVSVSTVTRWALDDARATLLARAGMTEEQLPLEARKQGLRAA